jgi:hypothetical protein
MVTENLSSTASLRDYRMMNIAAGFAVAHKHQTKIYQETSITTD